MGTGWPEAFGDVGRALGYSSSSAVISANWDAYNDACLDRPDEVQARIRALRYEDQPC